MSSGSQDPQAQEGWSKPEDQKPGTGLRSCRDSGLNSEGDGASADFEESACHSAQFHQAHGSQSPWQRPFSSQPPAVRRRPHAAQPVSTLRAPHSPERPGEAPGEGVGTCWKASFREACESRVEYGALQGLGSVLGRVDGELRASVRDGEGWMRREVPRSSPVA